MTRVVITGVGAITPIGNDPTTYWENMKAGVSGADKITAFDTDGYPVNVACEVKDFNPKDWIQDRKAAKRMARAVQFAVAASRQALEDARFEITPENAPSVGVVYNSGGGGLSGMETGTQDLIEKGPRGVWPFLVTYVMVNATASAVSIEFGASGPANTSVLACASGNYALIDAYHFLQRGEADVIIAGGTEATISPLIYASFARMGALSSQHNGDPTRASRPFDKDRDGFVYSEGAATFILETEAHAQARGAKIYAEVLGGRMTSDAHHVAAPRPDAQGATAAIKRTLHAINRRPEDISVVYAHGTSTPLGDIHETLALKQAFGEQAYQIPVSATKSQLGHALGGAGALSALAAVKSIEEDIICPTINYETPDPECDLDYVPNEARATPVNVALVNAFGFGGHNVVLALGKYQNGDN